MQLLARAGITQHARECTRTHSACHLVTANQCVTGPLQVRGGLPSVGCVHLSRGVRATCAVDARGTTLKHAVNSAAANGPHRRRPQEVSCMRERVWPHRAAGAAHIVCVTDLFLRVSRSFVSLHPSSRRHSRAVLYEVAAWRVGACMEFACAALCTCTR